MIIPRRPETCCSNITEEMNVCVPLDWIDLAVTRESNEMAGHVARMWERRGAYRVLVEKPEGKRPLGRHRRRWEDNIKMDLQEIGCGGMDWIELARDKDRWRAFVKAVMNLRVP